MWGSRALIRLDTASGVKFPGVCRSQQRCARRVSPASSRRLFPIQWRLAEGFLTPVAAPPKSVTARVNFVLDFHLESF